MKMEIRVTVYLLELNFFHGMIYYFKANANTIRENSLKSFD